MSTKRLQKKKAAMQAKKEKQLKKNTPAAKSVENTKVEVKKLETVKKTPATGCWSGSRTR